MHPVEHVDLALLVTELQVTVIEASLDAELSHCESWIRVIHLDHATQHAAQR